MILDSLKRILGSRSKSTTCDSPKGLEATGDVMSGVLVLRNKIKHLNKFRQACDQAGLGDDLKNAALSTRAFAILVTRRPPCRGAVCQLAAARPYSSRVNVVAPWTSDVERCPFLALSRHFCRR